MTCKRCIQRGQTWAGDAPVCAFDGAGNFMSSNWNCATMNELRDIAKKAQHDSEDQHCGVIPSDGNFIILGWYKRRGRTESAVVLSDADVFPLTLAMAEAVLGQLPRGEE